MHQSQPLKTTVSWNLPKLGLGCLPTPAKCLTTRPWWYLENWKHTHTCMHTHLILCQRLSDYFLMSPTLSQGKKNKSIKTHCSDMFHLFYFPPLSIGLPFTGGRGGGWGGGGEDMKPTNQTNSNTSTTVIHGVPNTAVDVKMWKFLLNEWMASVIFIAILICFIHLPSYRLLT